MAPFPQNKSSEGGVVSKLNQHFFHDESTWVPSSQKPLVLLHASGSDVKGSTQDCLLVFFMFSMFFLIVLCLGCFFCSRERRRVTGTRGRAKFRGEQGRAASSSGAVQLRSGKAYHC